MGMSILFPAPIFLLKVWDLSRKEAEHGEISLILHVIILKRFGLVSNPCGFDWV